MDVLFDEGVNFILYLQKSWAGWEKEMLFLSKVGDPRNSFLIYFPVVYHLNQNLGVCVLWTAIISEWLNLILKWVLRGDRPYWWVYESTKWENVTLQQYELTCETGPVYLNAWNRLFKHGCRKTVCRDQEVSCLRTQHKDRLENRPELKT